jgi:hypothetical protein
MAMRKHAAAALDGRANFIRIARKWARIAASPWKSNLGLRVYGCAEAQRAQRSLEELLAAGAYFEWLRRVE